MALTKHSFYLPMIMLVLAIFTTLAYVGTSLVGHDRINLNDDSIDYIAQLNGISSGIDEDIDIQSQQDVSQLGILESEGNATLLSTADYLAAINLKKERMSAPTNFFKIVYNIPSSILLSLKLPISEFRGLTNILGYGFFISLLLMVWLLLRA